MRVRMLKFASSSAPAVDAGASAECDAGGGASAPPARKSSKLVAGGGATSLACAPVVVKPMTRPVNTMEVHKLSDRLAVSLAMPGALGAFSQRATLLFLVRWNSVMLRPASPSNTNFSRNGGLL